MARNDKKVTKQNFHHGNLKETAAKLAYDHVVAEGVTSLNLRKIATQCGVDHSALYRHYKNKNSLITTIILRGFKELNAFQEEQNSQTAEEFLIAYVKFAFKSKNLYQLMFSQEGRSHFKDKKIETELQKLILKSAKAYSNVTSHQDITNEIRDAVMRAWAFIHGFIDLWQNGLFKARSDKLAMEYIIDQIRAFLRN